MIGVNTVIDDLEETPIAAGVADLARNPCRRLRVIHTLAPPKSIMGTDWRTAFASATGARSGFLIGSGNTDSFLVRLEDGKQACLDAAAR